MYVGSKSVLVRVLPRSRASRVCVYNIYKYINMMLIYNINIFIYINI